MRLLSAAGAVASIRRGDAKNETLLAEVFQHTGSGAERAGSPSLAASDDNGSNQVVVAPAVVCVTGDRTHALTSVGARGVSEDGTGRGTPIVAFRSRSTGDDGFGRDVSPSMTVAFHLTQDPISHPEHSPCLGTGSSSGAASVGVATGESVWSITPDAIDRKGEANSGTLADRPGLGIVEGHTQALRAKRPNIVATRYVVRRLTPTECLRLQALPDDWLDLDPLLSDSAKYRMTGNAGVVACVQWILSRLRDAARRATDGEA